MKIVILELKKCVFYPSFQIYFQFSADFLQNAATITQEIKYCMTGNEFMEVIWLGVYC